MIALGQLGTFDVENYGDLLYPIVFQHLLKRYRTRISVRPCSFLDAAAPQHAGFETIALRRLFNPAAHRQLGGARALRELLARRLARAR